MAGQRFNSGRVANWGRDFAIPGASSSPVLTGGAFFDGTGLVLPGTTGSSNRAQAPDSAALSITGDIDIQVKVTLANWTNAQTFLAKYGSSVERSYGFYVSAKLGFLYSTNGTIQPTIESSANHGIANGATKWVRFTLDVDNGASQHVAKFYLSDDGSTWTQLGTTITNAGTVSIFDGPAPLTFATGEASMAGAPPMNGTLHRAIIRNGYDGAGSVVFDADFSAVTANALAFTESSTNAATVSLTTNRYTYGLPNIQWNTSNVTEALTANRVHYQPFLVSSPLYVDGTYFHVTSGPASSANVRTGIYLADNNMQPTGGPVVDAGNTAVGTSATGTFFTQVTPTILQPGIYLTAINTSVALTVRVQRGGLVGTDVGNGTSSIINLMYASQTQGAFPNPGTAWDVRTFSTTSPNHYLTLRWRPA